MTVTVRFSGDLEAALAASRDRCESIGQSALRDIGHEFVLAAKTLAGSGPFSRSFTVVEEPGAVEAGSDSPMAAILEDGRAPGRRPPANVLSGSPAARARAADRIAARGTKGKRTVRKANAQIRDDGTVDRITHAALTAMADLGG